MAFSGQIKRCMGNGCVKVQRNGIVSVAHKGSHSAVTPCSVSASAPRAVHIRYDSRKLSARGSCCSEQGARGIDEEVNIEWSREGRGNRRQPCSLPVQ